MQRTPLVDERIVPVGGIEIHVADAGTGPAVLLLHGWPHTWRIWHAVLPGLVAAGFRVVAPDLRGMGASTRATEGYDLDTLAADAEGLLDALEIPDAAVVGIDAGVPIAWALGALHPTRVRQLVVMEGLLGTLPGAEAFLAAGPPWWFAFHAVPGLAETVLEGHEADYVDFFLRAGTADGRGIDRPTRDAFVAAQTGRDALRGGFEHYRAMPANARRIGELAAGPRSSVPTLAISGGVVGGSLHHQLEPITDDLAAHQIPDCAHLVPLEQPEALLHAMLAFVG